jgi:peroxiredoxin
MKYIVAIFFSLFALTAQADYLRTIGDFTLSTVTGEEVTLSNHTGLVAIYIQGNGCPIARLGSHDYREVIERFADQSVTFYMMNANIQDTPQAIISEESEFNFAVPILKDARQQVAKALGVDRTADVFVIIPESGEVVFRGPINDKLGYETQRTSTSNEYLTDAINTIFAGGTVNHNDIPDSKGCLVAIF